VSRIRSLAGVGQYSTKGTAVFRNSFNPVRLHRPWAEFQRWQPSKAPEGSFASNPAFTSRTPGSVLCNCGLVPSSYCSGHLALSNRPCLHRFKSPNRVIPFLRIVAHYVAQHVPTNSPLAQDRTRVSTYSLLETGRTFLSCAPSPHLGSIQPVF
jgi:hypothetical protein